MSDTASLENCKELYKLSGWKTDSMGLHQNSPSYDAGYLLRKLPAGTAVRGQTGGTWCADCWLLKDHDSGLPQFANTPEDALAMLAVQMFKKGILPISGRDL